jgi:predicted HTH domain antitoxin
MTTVAVEIPDSVFPAVQLDPKEFVKEMRLFAAIKWYELGRVSQGKGAEVANLSRAEFIKALSEAKVSPFEVSTEDLLEELHNAD